MSSITPKGQASQAPRLSEISEKDAKWDRHRTNTEKISRIYADRPSIFGKLADRLRQCAMYLLYEWKDHAETGESSIKLRQAKFCHARHCPVCSWRRALRSVGTFFRQLPDIEAKYPKSRWLFLTLTVKNVPLEHLRAEIVKMNRGWQRLIQRKDWPSDGWIRTVEVTRDKDGLAHPHFHAMLMVRPGYFSQGYVSQAEWTKRWRQVMRLDYDPIIDVRAIKPKVQGQTLQAAVVETLKYGTKVEDGMEHADWLYGITEQLHKMRFLASGGVLKGVMVEAKTDEELVGGDEPADEPGTGSKILFKWQRQELLYRKHGA